MEKNTAPLSKLTKAYLSKFFKNKNLPHEEWNITIDGVTHVIDNNRVINLILNARPEEQRQLADTLQELDASNMDINIFLKHLAFESNIINQLNKH